MEVIKDILRWIKSVFTKDNAKRFVHEVELSVVATTSETVNKFVNDADNQAAAREAVFAVAKDGLSGNEALDAAVGRLKAAGLAAGRDAATTLLRTLVQLVYAVVRAP